MARSRRGLTLTDLMALIAAVGVGLGLVVWMNSNRAFALTLVMAPALGIGWSRARGGRGILGGLLGGALHLMLSLVYYLSGAGGVSRTVMFYRPSGFAVLAAFCLGFGILMGLTAWLVALAMGSPGGRVDPEAS